MEELEKAVQAAAVVLAYLDKYHYTVAKHTMYSIWNMLEKQLCEMEDEAKSQTKGDDSE